MPIMPYLTKVIVIFIFASEKCKILNTCIVKPRIRNAAFMVGKAPNNLSASGMMHRFGGMDAFPPQSFLFGIRVFFYHQPTYNHG